MFLNFLKVFYCCSPVGRDFFKLLISSHLMYICFYLRSGTHCTIHLYFTFLYFGCQNCISERTRSEQPWNSTKQSAQFFYFFWRYSVAVRQVFATFLNCKFHQIKYIFFDPHNNITHRGGSCSVLGLFQNKLYFCHKRVTTVFLTCSVKFSKKWIISKSSATPPRVFRGCSVGIRPLNCSPGVQKRNYEQLREQCLGS